MKRAVLFLLLNLTICAIYAQSQPVSQRLDALLNDEILKTSEVGITVFDLTTGESLYRYQDEKLYRPASILLLSQRLPVLGQIIQWIPIFAIPGK